MIFNYDCIVVLIDNWLNKKNINDIKNINSCVDSFLEEDKYKYLKEDEVILNIIPCIMGTQILKRKIK